MKKKAYRLKSSMNLFYKPDRTTKPATVALYVLFVLVCLLGLSKLLIYDLWVEVEEARHTLAVEEGRLNDVMLQLADYDEVKERYCRYAATDEERALIDRMEILSLLDKTVGTAASMQVISVTGDTVQLEFSGVTLAETAQIVKRLEESPLVASTMVSTASTTQEEGSAVDYSAPVKTNITILLQKEVEEG